MLPTFEEMDVHGDFARYRRLAGANMAPGALFSGERIRDFIQKGLLRAWCVALYQGGNTAAVTPGNIASVRALAANGFLAGDGNGDALNQYLFGDITTNTLKHWQTTLRKPGQRQQASWIWHHANANGNSWPYSQSMKCGELGVS